MAAATGSDERPDPLRSLVSYNTRNLTKVVAEVGRATGAYWIDAVQRIARPGDAARRGLLWISAMADRREPTWHLANEVVLSTPFASLRDFTAAEHRDDDVVPTLVLPPQAGHSSTVVDYSPQQSQIAMIRASGLTKVYALDWRPATTATKNVTITDYLEVIDRSIRRMGGKANLVGDCQGGWLAVIWAALNPERVATLTIAGAPIDYHCGEPVLWDWVQALAPDGGIANYETIVANGGGVLPGASMLAGFIALKPENEIDRRAQKHVLPAAFQA